jgi:hypothetical protein
MRVEMKYTTVLLTIVVLLMTGVNADAINSKAGTASYTFLKIGSAARSQGLAGAFVGLSDDESALFYNPAGLTAKGDTYELFDDLLDQPTIHKTKNWFTATYMDYLLDFQYGFLGYIRELDENSKGGISITYLNYGEFIGLDDNGDPTNNNFTPMDIALSATYSERFAPQFSAGITGKFIYEKIEDYTSNGLAVDIGFMYLVNEKGTSKIGLAITNLGTQLSGLTETHKDPLPTKITLGSSHQLRGLPLVFTDEVGKPFDNEFYFAVGAELIAFDPFFVRVGWTSASMDYRVGEDDSDDLIGGFSGGFGYSLNKYTFDYSYSSYADLGNAHRISFGAGF